MMLPLSAFVVHHSCFKLPKRMPTLIDTLEHETWVLKEWKVRFLFSEKVIKMISYKATSPIWY